MVKTGKMEECVVYGCYLNFTVEENVSDEELCWNVWETTESTWYMSEGNMSIHVRNKTRECSRMVSSKDGLGLVKETVDKETTMAEPTDYITATRKNFITNEVASEWFTKECIGLITTWDNMVQKFIMKFHHLSDHNEEEETEEDLTSQINMDNVPKSLRLEGKLFDFETPLCEAYYEFNCLLKIDTDLFTYDTQKFKTYGEYKQELNDNKAKGTEKPWSENRVADYFQDHRGFVDLADGKLKDKTLARKGKNRRYSMGRHDSRVIKFFCWVEELLET
ncbi:hypothetical protein Tco_0404959 [Tanacetum coccineum]